MSGRDYVDGGTTLKDARITARLLEEAGADALSVSAGVYPFSLEWIIQPVLIRTGCLVPLASEIRREVKIPVMVAGRINTPKLAEAIVEAQKADLVVLGRALLADPDFPRKALAGKTREIRTCLACNTCVQAERGMGPVRCLMNPELAREGETEPKASAVKNVVVLGGGPAGLEAARVARLRGHRVALWDENEKLGGRWSWLVKPYVKEMVSQLRQLGVRVELGKSFDLGALSQVAPDVVVATAGKAVRVPQVPGVDGHNVRHADDVLEGRGDVGQKVAILGAGNIGFEVTEFLSRKRIQLNIIDSATEAGYGVERDPKKILTDRFRDRGIRIWTDSKVVRITEDRVYFKDSEDRERSVEADTVVLALGSEADPRTIETLREGAFELYTVGYCERPEGVYSSTQEGASIARQI
jgi:NADPH-dependent 2,4-dienoyl-CoA reductase/sulfur reductase-like enzyme